MRPQRGAVTTVTSGEIPRIHPVHRSVAVASSVVIVWMWNGRLTYTKDQANEPQNIATGRVCGPPSLTGAIGAGACGASMCRSCQIAAEDASRGRPRRRRRTRGLGELAMPPRGRPARSATPEARDDIRLPGAPQRAGTVADALAILRARADTLEGGGRRHAHPARRPAAVRGNRIEPQPVGRHGDQERTRLGPPHGERGRFVGHGTLLGGSMKTARHPLPAIYARWPRSRESKIVRDPLELVRAEQIRTANGGSTPPGRAAPGPRGGRRRGSPSG